MAEEDRNVLLKSIDTGIGTLKDMFGSLKDKDVDVSKFEKSLNDVETKVKEFKDQEDLVKILEGEKTDLQKTLDEKDEEIKTLQKTVDDGKEEADKKAHDALVSTALDLCKDLDAKTEVKDEDAYVKVLSKSFTEDEIKYLDTCIKTDIKAMEIAKTHIPEGDLPGDGDNDPNEEIDEDAQRAKDLRKKYEDDGLLVKTGDE
jgi:predicted RNase H-like nuclease (RuvC/YqgF family)